MIFLLQGKVVKIGFMGFRKSGLCIVFEHCFPGQTGRVKAVALISCVFSFISLFLLRICRIDACFGGPFHALPIWFSIMSLVCTHYK